MLFVPEEGSDVGNDGRKWFGVPDLCVASAFACFCRKTFVSYALKKKEMSGCTSGAASSINAAFIGNIVAAPVIAELLNTPADQIILQKKI